MKIFQSYFKNNRWSDELPSGSDAQLVLAFGSKEHAKNSDFMASLSSAFPAADIIGCTTSGEIWDDIIYDDSFCISAITWEKTYTQITSGNIANYEDSKHAGKAIASNLSPDKLSHVLIFSDGHTVNGSDLVAGIHEALPKNVSISGGLAGDGERFQETWAWHNEKREPGNIVVCGLYGDALKIGSGSVGGWDAFGPDRLVTRAEGNILYELDGESALTLYKTYLGEHAEKLPSSALMFPLNVREKHETQGLVRTILDIDEGNNSMIFAGDIKEGSYARLMHASFEQLIDGAGQAANNSRFEDQTPTSLALLISCVGRRIVLGQHTDQELEVVKETLGEKTLLCGFYSYGEISPREKEANSCLHNQTMTITTFTEVF